MPDLAAFQPTLVVVPNNAYLSSIDMGGRAFAPVGYVPVPPDPTFYVDSIDASAFSITINLSMDVLGSSVPTDPIYWSITGGTVPVQVLSVSVLTDSIILTITEGKAGETLTVHVPYNALLSSEQTLFDGPLAVSYTSVAQSPVLVQAQVIDNTHVRVIYSEPVQSASATVTTNYSINNGLTVLGVTQENERNYIIETSTQTPATNYTVTVNNVVDLYGNPV